MIMSDNVAQMYTPPPPPPISLATEANINGITLNWHAAESDSVAGYRMTSTSIYL